MNYEEILERTIALFAKMTDAETEITEDSELMEDLGISSMDVLILICNLEEEFKIKVPESAIRKMYTIADVAETVVQLIGK